MKKAIGLLLMIAGAVVAFFGVAAVLRQHRDIQSYVPVAATVDSIKVTVHRARRSTSYRVDIAYHYERGGKTYHATRIYPFDENPETEGETNRLSAFFQSGRQVVAYVDPEAAGDSFLVREYSMSPYSWALLAAAGVVAGACVWTGFLWPRRKNMLAIGVDESGWKLVMPVRTVRDVYRDAQVLAVGVTIPVVLLMGHYFRVNREPSMVGYIVGGGCALVVSGALIWLWRRWNLAGHVSDARLRVMPAPMRRGEPLLIEVEVDAYGGGEVEGLDARVVCVEHYKEQQGRKVSVGTREHMGLTAKLAGAMSVGRGEVISGKGELMFDTAAPPSTTDLMIGERYPWYSWEIRVELRLRAAVDYKASFPLEVV